MSTPFGDIEFGKLTVFCDKIVELLKANQEALGLKDVFYGDQLQIPRTPTAVVEPDGKRRMLAGVPRRTENTFGAYVILYLSELSSNVQVNARESIVIAESVEDLLNATNNHQMGGYLIHSFCTEVEPGYRTRGNTRFRACRIKYEGLNKTVLGM